MDDAERRAEIERLLASLSDAKARHAALVAEEKEFGSRIKEIRAAFGNPFFYSGKNHGRPENADKSIEKFSGQNSHDVVLPTIFRLLDVNAELKTIRERLRALGANVE